MNNFFSKYCSKHKKTIIAIIIVKILFLFILKNYLFNQPLAKHMKLPQQTIEQHIFN